MLNDRENLEDVDIQGIILKCILKQLDRWVWMGLIWLRTGQVLVHLLWTFIVHTTQGIS
jgi:hypothetical protein